jgi:hypothetical protein
MKADHLVAAFDNSRKICNMAARNMFALQIENSFQRIDGTLETKDKKINLPIIQTSHQFR